MPMDWRPSSKNMDVRAHPQRPAPSVSVIICAYTDRRWPVLVDAVGSVLAQRPAPLEVVLVIDHNDALLARARSELPGAVVIANAERQGLSGARNTGVARAAGEVVAFLDDDAVARPGWLASLTAAYGDASVIGTGGVAVPRWETGKPAWFPDEFLWVVGCTYRGLPEQLAPIRNPIGANMAFRRAACTDAGGFSHGIGRVGNTPLGCEETELSIRVRAGNDGATILQVPGAAVDHLVTAERVRWEYFRSRCWAEGLSKALVTDSVGHDAGLASERTYATRTLPAGVLRGVAEALRGDVDGLRRAAAIVAGLAITTAGFARGTIARRRGEA
jgi:glycosyltransferase involved in cell wall biosynthesis